MAEYGADIFSHDSGSFGAKKWVSGTAVADYGNSQAFAVAPVRRAFTAFQVSWGMLTNRSLNPATLGLGVRYRISSWQAGTVTAAGVYTDDTTDAQDAGAGDFVLHTGADDGSGFLLAATERFNTVALIQSAAGDQTDPIALVEYWDGTSWVDIVGTCFIADTLIGDGTGEKVLCFPMPFPWVVGGSGTGVPTETYNLRVRHTNSGAGSETPAASQIFLGFADIVFETVQDGATVSILRNYPLRFPRSGEALFPLTSVASDRNYVSLDYQFYS